MPSASTSCPSPNQQPIVLVPLGLLPIWVALCFMFFLFLFLRARKKRKNVVAAKMTSLHKHQNDSS